MSQAQHASPSLRRTSERRRQKLLRGRDSFRAPNPFRLGQRVPLPEQLARHLRKIEYLTSESISQLDFGRKLLEGRGGEIMLDQMQEAIHMQEERFSSLLGSPVTRSQEVEEGWVLGVECPAIEGEEVVQTKDEISRNIFSPRDPRGEEEIGCDQLLDIHPQPAHPPVPSQSLAPAILEQQVSHYFAD